MGDVPLGASRAVPSGVSASKIAGIVGASEGGFSRQEKNTRTVEHGK